MPALFMRVLAMWITCKMQPVFFSNMRSLKMISLSFLDLECPLKKVPSNTELSMKINISPSFRCPSLANSSTFSVKLFVFSQF